MSGRGNTEEAETVVYVRMKMMVGNKRRRPDERIHDQ
jgi:hypothetical protein